MGSAIRVWFALALLAAITAGGAAGYVAIEGWSWNEAFYMSVITLSTVGYGEPRELTATGRLFTVAFIVLGVGTALYLLSAIAGTIAEGRLRAQMQRRALQRRIHRMRDHVIITGYGRFGRAVTDELKSEGCPLVVVEKDAAVEPELADQGLEYIIGSAACDEVLERAGIATASAIVVATGSEAENVFIVLAARELGPSLRIHARAETESGTRRLERAGADRVTAPFQMGGMRAAASILRPAVVDFFELSAPRRGETVDLEEVRVEAGSQIAGCELSSLTGTSTRHRVVAIKRDREPIALAPSEEEVVCAGDHLVVIGPRSDLNQLARQAQASDR